MFYREIDDALGISETTPCITPTTNSNTPDFIVNTPSPSHALPSQPSLPGGSSVVSSELDILMKRLGPYPYAAPPGFNWVPNGWKLEPNQESTPTSSRNVEKSFEDLFLDKIEGTTEKTKRKRQKLDLRCKEEAL